MDTTDFSFINFAVEGGGTRHYDLPILKRANKIKILMLPIFLVGFLSLLIFDDVRTRIIYFSDTSIPVCQKGQGFYESGPCLILPEFLFYAAIAFIVLFGWFLIGTLHRLYRLARINGPHLKVDRQSFWCDELLEPIKFEYIENLVPLYSKHNRLYGLEFALKIHVEFTAERKWRWGTGKKSDFYWVSLGYDDPVGLINAVIFLFEEYKSAQK